MLVAVDEVPGGPGTLPNPVHHFRIPAAPPGIPTAVELTVVKRLARPRLHVADAVQKQGHPRVFSASSTKSLGSYAQRDI
jgi:hypothetical protein